MTAASIAARAAIVLASAAAMEAVALLVHRHLMHGPGWGWHRSHHEPAPAGGWWERNDWYAVVFASFAFLLMLVGQGPWWPLYWVGGGLTLYGALYAAVHDGLVHRRWPLLRWNPRRGSYLARLVQAHRLHHAVRGRDGCVSFGFLYAPSPARLAAALRQRRGRPGAAADDAAGQPAAPAFEPAAGGPAARRRQSATGLLLAALIAGGWLAAQAGLLFHLEWSAPGALPWAALGVAAVCWLDVGLFIVAHDAMHGSLAPSSPLLNRVVGRLCLLLYAGFSLDRFIAGHFRHHRDPGTADDPDFAPGGGRFWPWYGRFMRRYFGWQEAAGLALVFGLLVGVLRAPLANTMVFWALPAVLSSLQLFAFGTWLPHRLTAGGAAFADRHRARSNDYGWLASLLSCFHFGYHHEHHLRPDAPWWRLPAVRRRSTKGLPRRAEDGSAAATAATGVRPGFAAPAGSTSLRGAPADRPVRAAPPCSPPR